MQLSSFALLAALASANALTNSVPVSPMDAVSHTVNLFNGVDVITATVGHPDISTLPIPAGGKNMCAGSAFCNNGQPFRDQCEEAFYKIQNVVYTTGGTGSGGTCSGKCGFFLEGDNCRATKEEFEKAYTTIRHTNNCLACGYAFKPRTGASLSKADLEVHILMVLKQAGFK
ncbi:hypothetical protein V492_07550 [Pseudogymnoascus sp. VKM F-4246]|nr:hypothetical protein V492_07550 [Pseudogymnoascus sp. VKM F-4246]